MHNYGLFGYLIDGFLDSLPIWVVYAMVITFFGTMALLPVLDRLFDPPIMRKRVNAGSDGWQRPRRYRAPDPRRFRAVGTFNGNKDRDAF